MADRTPRYTDAEKQAIAQARRERANAARAGKNPGPIPPSELARIAQLLQFGRYVPLSWQRQFRDGEWYLRPFDKQTGRIAAGNWQPGEWRPASQVLTPGHYAALMRTSTGPKADARQAWAAANPGGNYYDWLSYKAGNTPATSPTTPPTTPAPLPGTSGLTPPATSGLTDADFSDAVNRAFQPQTQPVTQPLSPATPAQVTPTQPGSLIPDSGIEDVLRRRRDELSAPSSGGF